MSPHTSETDLRKALDASIRRGEPAPPFTTDDLVAGGRGRLRRRRLITGAGALTALALITGGAWALGASDDGSNDPPGTPAVAASDPAAPSTSPSATSKKDRRAERLMDTMVSNSYPAMLDPRGGVVVKDGWRITRRVPEPVGFTAPERSLGVIVTNGTRTRWMLLTLTLSQDENGKDIPGSEGPGASMDVPENTSYVSFDDWLASMVELEDPSKGPAPLVTEGPDGDLAAGPGATLVDTREAPVIERYTDPGDRMAKVERDGTTWFVMVRGTGRTFDPIPVDAAKLAAPTFEAFVDHLTAKVASGEGAR